MKNHHVAFMCFLISTVISGCITVQEDIDTFNKKKVCCTGYDDMLIWKWDGKNSYIADLKANAPIYAFDEGRSRFTALEFSSDMANLKLDIRARNQDLEGEKALFYPAITFLDKDKKKINLNEENKLKIESIGTSDGTTVFASAVAPQGAKYAIIHSARTNFGESNTMAGTTMSNMIAVNGMYFYMPGYTKEYKFLYSPSAEITIAVDKK